MADTTTIKHELIDNAGGKLSLDGDTIKVAGILSAGTLKARLRTTIIHEYEQNIAVEQGGFGIDFIARRARKGDVIVPMDSLVSCLRASSGKTFDGTVWSDAPPNTLRYARQSGLLMEPARTNDIRNSTMAGGTASVAPRFWNVITHRGMIIKGYEYGSTAGIRYVDVTMGGTSAAGAEGLIDTETSIPVKAGDELYYSAYLAIIRNTGAKLLRLLPGARFGKADGTVANVPNSWGPDIKDQATATMARYDHFAQVTDPVVVSASPRVQFVFEAGAIDFTLRIGAPQFERGPLPTSFIDTTGSAATRAADAVTVALPSGAHNLAITYADGFVRQITGVSGNYTLPVDPNRPIIKNIVGARA